MPDARPMTTAQRAYEAKRAAKAGMSLDRWLVEKQKQADRATRDSDRAKKEAEKQAKPAGLLRRLLDRAHKPL